MSQKIQSLSPAHIAAMAALHEQAFHTGWSEADFLANIDNEHDDVLGLVDRSRLNGFILIRTLEDQSEILTIVVDSEKRKHGAGSQLLHAGEEAAQSRGAEIMFLEVAKDNPAAIQLYQKYGYQRCGTRKSYYRREKGRVDALLFQKKLNS